MPEDLAAARYIRLHHEALRGLLKNAGKGLSRAQKEELEQVAMMGVILAVRALAALPGFPPARMLVKDGVAA
jgi:hypothetical protein